MRSTEQENLHGADNGANPKIFKLGYVTALDGVRGMSVFAVMAFNSRLLLMRGGFIGVDIFFVLSGFLITSLLVQGYGKASSIGLKNFYFRRALRLLPALFVLLLFCIAYALIFQTRESGSTTLTGVFYTFFYVANWAQIPPAPIDIGPLSHAWSLSVEEQFYIIWPLLLLILLKLKRRGVVFATLSSLIMLSFLSSVLLWHTGAPSSRIYLGSDTRAHELLIGCVAALLVSWGILQSTTRLRHVIHVASVLSLAGILLSFFIARYDKSFVYNGGFTVLSIGTAVLILDLVLLPSPLSRLFEFAPLVWIGRISYGLYLWHFPIFLASRKFKGWMHPLLFEAVVVGFTVLVATASFYLLERRFLRLRLRYSTKDTVFNSLSPSPQTAEIK